MTEEMRKTPPLKRPRAKGWKRNFWTFPELKRLEARYSSATIAELKEEFPRHTIDSICSMGRRLGMSRNHHKSGRPISWKTIRAAKLRQIGMEYAHISERLGLTIDAAYNAVRGAKRLKYNPIGVRMIR